MSDAPHLLIEALRDRLNRALLRAEQAEAERDALADTNRRNVGLLEVLERQGVELEAAKQAAASAECTRMHYRERAWRAESALERRMAERDALREALKAAIEQRDALRARWAALKSWAEEQHRLSMGASRLVEVSDVVQKMSELEARNVD